MGRGETSVSELNPPQRRARETRFLLSKILDFSTFTARHSSTSVYRKPCQYRGPSETKAFQAKIKLPNGSLEKIHPLSPKCGFLQEYRLVSNLIYMSNYCRISMMASQMEKGWVIALDGGDAVMMTMMVTVFSTHGLGTELVRTCS